MKIVSEIFGLSSKNKLMNPDRKDFMCPFTKNQCDPINKKSNLTDSKGNLILNHQTGACSCYYKSNLDTKYSPVIICPMRFEEKNLNNEIIVFKKIKNFFFNDKKIMFSKEIGLKGYGRADFMISTIENSKVVDFAHLEFQSDATTGTRGIVECVKDFYDGKNLKKSYKYGLNTKATIKAFSLQMIDKGYLFKKLNKLSIWIMQDKLIEKFKSIYNIKLNHVKSYNINLKAMIYILEVILVPNNDKSKYNLTTGKVYMTSSDEIQLAISKKEVLDENYIISNINNNQNKKIYFD